jgi:tRNA pseudouridine55 synthase
MILKLRIVCSKGTYIRALARDLGEAMQSGAHLVSLRRTRVGEFKDTDCMSLEELEDMINRMKQNEI